MELMRHEPKLCPNCKAIVFWNSHFQAYNCVKCGSILKPDDTIDIRSEPMKIYQVTAHDNEEYFRERKNAEEYLKMCGSGKLVEIILKDTVKE